MYKKFFFTLVPLFIGLCFAENIVVQSGTIATITPDMSVIQNNDINKIGMIYCDEDLLHGSGFNKKYSYKTTIDMRPGKRGDICTAFVNHGENNAQIKIILVDGIEENGKVKCSLEGSGIFSNIFSDKEREIVLSLSSGETIIKMFNIKIPKKAKGKIYGCVTYMSNIPLDFSTGQVFAVQIRKTAPITINITGSVYKFGRRDDIKYAYKDNQSMILKIIIAILTLRIIVTIVQMSKKKSDHHKKK